MENHGGKLFLSWVCLAGFFFFGLIDAEAGFKTVIIDAGHGGHDLGASRSLIYEKHLNLDVARRLERTLRESGFRTDRPRAC